MLKHILVAPLDWGLGHATRCIPVIRQLLASGCKVTVAAAGNTKILLQNEFPGILFVQLEGYNVEYSATKRFLPIKILSQAPKIMAAIRREHAWLQKAVSKYRFDAVISDNRFGLYTAKVPCVFITHQLLIQAPFAWLQRWVQRVNYHYINRYKACWVPDFESGSTLAGRLSHPAKMPEVPVKYIGALSRFKRVPEAPPKYAWMMIMSGPEPQRSILEQKLLAIMQALQGPVLLVRGKPGSAESLNGPPNCTVINHLDTDAMREAAAESEFIISRCGYTTVMEMLSLGKKAVLIPTPGQTEQEYLARHLAEQKWAYYCEQEDNLAAHLTAAQSFNFKRPPLQQNKLEEAVDAFLASL